MIQLSENLKNPSIGWIEYEIIGKKFYRLKRKYINQIDIYPEKDISTHDITLLSYGRLEIEYGYGWDGSSGPTWDSDKDKRASLEHDALCELMRSGLLDRKWETRADELYYERCIEDGMWKWQAKNRLFWLKKTTFYTDPKNARPIYRAPKGKEKK